MSETALLKLLVIGFVFVDAILIAALTALFLNSKQKALLKWIGLATLPLLIGFAVYVDAFIVEPNSIQIKKLAIKIDDLPREVEKLKIAQISDLHIESYGFHEKSLIAYLNIIKPDILLITGDFLNSKAALASTLKVVSELKARRGVYAVLGDSDYIAFKGPGLAEKLQEAGIRVLDNENVKLRVSDKANLWLIGINGARIRPAQIREAFRGVSLMEPKIVMVHSPNIAEQAILRNYGVDLVLAGDTHGTQMGLSFIRRLSSYASRSKYVAGLYNVGGVRLYVNKGIGTKAKDMRFFCLPEITLVKLVRG